MNWDKRIADDYIFFELCFPPLKTTVVARHKLANWIVFDEPLRIADARSLAPIKPIAWGECDDPVQARTDAEAAMTVIQFCRATPTSAGSPASGYQMSGSHMLWPESTTGVIHQGRGADRFLVPCATAAQKLLQSWGLRPYYEGNGGMGQLVLIAAEWAPFTWMCGRREENAIVWSGAVRDPLAANEMALGLAELFGHIGRNSAGYPAGQLADRAATVLRFADRQGARSTESRPIPSS